MTISKNLEWPRLAQQICGTELLLLLTQLKDQEAN